MVSVADGEKLVEVVDADIDIDLEGAEAMCDTVEQADPDVLHRDVALDWGDGVVVAPVVGCFPVTTDTRDVGTLMLVWTRPGPAPEQAQLDAVRGMAIQAAVSLTLDVARLSEHKNCSCSVIETGSRATCTIWSSSACSPAVSRCRCSGVAPTCRRTPAPASPNSSARWMRPSCRSATRSSSCAKGSAEPGR